MLGPKVEECWGAKFWSVRENLGWEPKSVAVLEEGDNSGNASQKVTFEPRVSEIWILLAEAVVEGRQRTWRKSCLGWSRSHEILNNIGKNYNEMGS